MLASLNFVLLYKIIVHILQNNLKFLFKPLIPLVGGGGGGGGISKITEIYAQLFFDRFPILNFTPLSKTAAEI